MRPAEGLGGPQERSKEAVLGGLDLAVRVAVPLVGVVQVIADEVVGVIAVGDRGVTAVGAVGVAAVVAVARVVRGAVSRVGPAHLELVLVDMILVGMMQMAIMEIVDVPLVDDSRMAAVGAVQVVMVSVGGMVAHGSVSVFLGMVLLRRMLENDANQVGHVLVGQAVVHVLALAAADYQPLAPQSLESL